MLTIKNLRYVNNAQTFKLNDTSTRLRLQASLGSTVVDFSEKDNLSVKIKNASGYLMEVEPTVDSNKTLSFNSSQLQELPVGHYEIELWVDNQAGTSIYPSKGYLSFTINENSIGFNGEAIPTITLHDFEERIDKLEKDLRAKADNGDFDGEKGEPGDKGDPGKDATNNDPNAVHVSGNQAISGVKNFIDTPTINGNKVLDDSLQIGGQNYIENSQPTNDSGWVFSSYGTNHYKVVDGQYIEITRTGGSYHQINRQYQNDKDGWFSEIKPGDHFAISMDISMPTIPPLDSNMYGNLRLNAGDTFNSNHANWNLKDIIKKANTWYRVSAVTDIPDNWETDFTKATRARFLIESSSGSNTDVIRIRNIKLEKGNKATDWSPAPEDIGTSRPIMSGNYGLRVTADGFQKTTDGGATWTTADI